MFVKQPLASPGSANHCYITIDPLPSYRHLPEGPLGVRPVPEGVKDLLDGHNGAALPVGGLPHHAVGSLEGRKVGDDVIAI